MFLYNSELWNVNKKLETKINVYQRILLRKILKIYYPYKITNEELYKRTREENWSNTIRKRRLRWTGHLLRLDENAPASLALRESLRQHGKKKRGNCKIWRHIVNEDLKSVNLSLEHDNIRTIAEDRDKWSVLIKQILEAKSTTDDDVPVKAST